MIYRTSKTFDVMKGFAHNLQFEILVEVPKLEFRTKPKSVEEFLSTNIDFPLYLVGTNLRALDPFKAREEADEKLFLFDSIARYHVHRRDLRISEDALVYSIDHKDYGIVRKFKSAIMKRPDREFSELSSLAEDTVRTIRSDKLDGVSLMRLTRALLRHNTAALSATPESQLLEFWSAVEVLFPPTDENADRIVQISDSMTPFVTSEYAAKLASDLFNSIRNSGQPEAIEILNQIPEGDNNIEKCLALFSVETNEPIRDKLYQLFKWNPLLKNRIFFLKKRFSSADLVLKTLTSHIERISWQIRRIYRAWNLIIHSGKSLPYIDILVENLHSYLDRVLDLLIEKISRSPHSTTIDQIALEIKLEAESHLRILKHLRKTQSNTDNYKLILFGNKDYKKPETKEGGTTGIPN